MTDPDETELTPEESLEIEKNLEKGLAARHTAREETIKKLERLEDEVTGEPADRSAVRHSDGAAPDRAGKPVDTPGLKEPQDEGGDTEAETTKNDSEDSDKELDIF